MTRLDSVIFDLDGTLWDVNPTVAKARNNVLRSLGIRYKEFTAEDVARTVGLPIDEVYRRGFPGLEEHHERLKPLVAAEIKRLLPVEGATLYPGLREELPRLKERFRLFIVSNCGAGYIEAFLGWSGLGPMFEDHECYGRTGLSKGENILSVIRRNHLRAPAYVGDTAGDQEAAIHARIPYFHLNYGFGEPVAPCERFDSFGALARRLLSVEPSG